MTASSQTGGATVIQWPRTGNPNQLWRLQPYNSTWRLVASRSGQCLNVTGGGSTPATALIQWPCSGDANELWSLHMPTPIAKWSGVIPTTVDPVAAANLPNGTLLAWSAEQALTFGTGSG